MINKDIERELYAAKNDKERIEISLKSDERLNMELEMVSDPLFTVNYAVMIIVMVVVIVTHFESFRNLTKLK